MDSFSIRIISDTPVNEVHVKKALRDHFEQEQNNIKRELKVETIREIILSLMG